MAAGAVLRDVDRGILYFQNVTVHARVRVFDAQKKNEPFVHLTGSVRQHYMQISYSEFHPSRTVQMRRTG